MHLWSWIKWRVHPWPWDLPEMLGTLAPRVANDILLPALGPIQGYKVQHLFVTWGRLKRFFFSILALTRLLVKPLGADFNFCTNKNAWFELDRSLDSECKVGLSWTNLHPSCEWIGHTWRGANYPITLQYFQAPRATRCDIKTWSPSADTW
jgi:hypothetical protein